MANLEDGAPEVSILNYQLVEFFLTSPEPPAKPIEIIPSTWIVESGKQKRAICKFPPGPDYDGLQDMVKNLESCDENWPGFPVTIKGQADTYEEAEVFLKELEIAPDDIAIDPKHEDLSDKSLARADNTSNRGMMNFILKLAGNPGKTDLLVAFGTCFISLFIFLHLNYIDGTFYRHQYFHV